MMLAICMGSPMVRADEQPPSFDHVILISVDGLRPECLQPEMASAYPALARLARGPHTLQARCDPDISITLPNHCDMITGRLAAGTSGHGWLKNEDPPARKHGGTLHANKVDYVSSIFDVAHDRGARTALICGKWKFVLFEQSYGQDAGGPDKVAPDNSRDKIDLFVCDSEALSQSDSVLATIRHAAATNQKSLTLWHIPTPDFQGHATGWDVSEGSPYRQSVATVDHGIENILTQVDADAHVRGRVAIVLTADHGGGVPAISHVDAEAPINFTIPFLVWLAKDSQACDLYGMNPECRSLPAASQRFVPDARPPIRNADAANVALGLIGLPPIPGSTANAQQELRVSPTPHHPIQAQAADKGAPHDS